MSSREQTGQSPNPNDTQNESKHSGPTPERAENSPPLSPAASEILRTEEAYRRAVKRANYALRAYNGTKYEGQDKALALADALTAAAKTAEDLAEAMQNAWNKQP